VGDRSGENHASGRCGRGLFCKRRTPATANCTPIVCTLLAIAPRVRRILLVLRGPIQKKLVLGCGEALQATDALVAVCYELPSGRDSLAEGLAAQRELTSLLRDVCGERAESVPVFTASDREGESVADCQSSWGATEVKP